MVDILGLYFISFHFILFVFFISELLIPFFTRSNHSAEISFLSVFSSAISVSVSIRHGLSKSLQPPAPSPSAPCGVISSPLLDHEARVCAV